jgi:hypothetical protein
MPTIGIGAKIGKKTKQNKTKQMLAIFVFITYANS